MELVQEEDFLFQSLWKYESVYMSEYVYVYHWFLCVCHNRIRESTSSSYIEPARDGEPTVGSEANSVFECRPHRLLCQQSNGGQHHGVSSSVSLQVQNPTSQESKPGEAHRGGGGGRSLLSWKFVKEAKVERQSKLEQNQNWNSLAEGCKKYETCTGSTKVSWFHDKSEQADFLFID